MPKWILAIVVVITTALLLLLVTSFVAKRPAVITPVSTSDDSAIIETDRATGLRTFRPRPGLEGFAIPEFSLINQAGEPVDQSILEGRITVVAFIFTHCQLACPPMTANMLRLYRMLEDTPVQFASFSVDPEHDTPERLTEYAGLLNIDPKRWVFLTGEEGQTGRVVAESLKFEISADPDDSTMITLGDGSTMRNIRHPTKLFLVGPDRQILDFCSPTVPEELARFAAVARKAAG